MKKVYEDNYDVILSAINSSLDQIYDLLDYDSTRDPDMRTHDNSTIEKLKETAESFEELRTAFINKGELTSFMENQIQLVLAQTMNNMKVRAEEYSRAADGLAAILNFVKIAQN